MSARTSSPGGGTFVRAEISIVGNHGDLIVVTAMDPRSFGRVKHAPPPPMAADGTEYLDALHVVWSRLMVPADPRPGAAIRMAELAIGGALNLGGEQRRMALRRGIGLALAALELEERAR